MNELQKAFINGARIAYMDVHDKVIDMIEKAPPELSGIIRCLKPIADACEQKAANVESAIAETGLMPN